MGIRVQTALLSSLLIAALFFAPITQADDTATTTEIIAGEQGTATSTEDNLSSEESIRAADAVPEVFTEESTEDSSSIATPEISPTDEEEEEEEDPFAFIKGRLFQNEHFSLSLSWNGQMLTDGGTVSAPSGNLQWSYTDHSPAYFFPPFIFRPVSFLDAIAASTLTFQIYKGEVGAATLLHSEVVPYGTAPEIPFSSLSEGQYLFVFSSTFPKDTYPPGLSPEELCSGGGDRCVLYQTRIDDFTWFMEHGQALYDDTEDEIDAQGVVIEDGEQVNRMNRFRPMAFGITEVTVGAPTPSVSNVLFLPGIKGSKLYKNESECDPNSSSCDIKLWVPNGDARVRELFLNAVGQSNNDVYVKDRQIIDSAGGQKFYASFIDDMNARDANDEYGAAWTWRPVAYDWRLSLPDIVNNGTKHGDNIYYNQATSTPYIEQTLRELAQTSSTRKVTIVAHSNGGLVAKALLQKLGDAETAELVDKIIFVGVPQSGAPQAIGGLLFGYAEGLPGKAFLPDFIMTKSTARELAENSPMAYHLLPSFAYLRDTQDPKHAVISFTGSHLYQEEQNRYGPTVDTIEELDDFLLARDGGRLKPAYSDLTVANVLNAGLITYANTQHDAIDAWKPPTGVTLYQIAGWGADTVSGVDFYDERKILGFNVGHKRQYRPVFVEDGDGVVPVPSALMTGAASNVKNYWLNFKKIREQSGNKYDHGNFLESSSALSAINNFLLGTEIASEFLTSVRPAETSQSKKLIFQLHSPLTLGIYDSSGNYTGLNADGSVSENVSDAQYGEFGDVKYLIAPAGQKYTLALRGQSTGTFSLDIQEKSGNTITTTSTISDVPTTSQTNASLIITSGVTDASSLSVDENGDGSTDFEIAPTIGETIAYTTPIVDTVESLSGTTSGSKSINQSSTEVKVDTNTATAFQPPLPTTKEKPAAYVVPIIVLSQPSSVESVPGATVSTTTKGNHTQTASVYDSFAPLTEWIKSLLYNVRSWFNYLINRYLTYEK